MRVARSTWGWDEATTAGYRRRIANGMVELHNAGLRRPSPSLLSAAAELGDLLMSTKLKPEQVRMIRRWAGGRHKKSYRWLAKRYYMDTSTIYKVVNRLTWKELPDVVTN